MKHLWYCRRCYTVFYMPWINAQLLETGQSTIKEIERHCDVCKVIQTFRSVTMEQ